MRLVRDVLVMILVASACRPDSPVRQSLTEPLMGKKDQVLKDGAKPVFETPDGMRVFRLEDLEPSVLLHMQKQMESPEFKASLANAPVQPLRYAVADDALPQGADAVVLRDGTGAQDRMIVVSRETASDRVLLIARFALLQDEHAEPSLTGQKTILVWDDGRTSVNDKIKKIHAYFGANPGEAKALLDQKGEITHLRGIGKARTVRAQ
jgi:hypothetical protein